MNAEEFVDSQLHLFISMEINKVHRKMKKIARVNLTYDEKPVFILATGDGNSHDGHSSFPAVCISFHISSTQNLLIHFVDGRTRT